MLIRDDTVGWEVLQLRVFHAPFVRDFRRDVSTCGLAVVCYIHGIEGDSIVVPDFGIDQRGGVGWVVAVGLRHALPDGLKKGREFRCGSTDVLPLVGLARAIHPQVFGVALQHIGGRKAGDHFQPLAKGFIHEATIARDVFGRAGREQFLFLPHVA